MNDVIEKLQSTSSFLSAHLRQIVLPLLRHCGKEPRVLGCARLSAKRSYVLCPVHKLLVFAVAAAIGSNECMIVVKLDLVIEDLCLHRFIVKLRRKPVLVGINAHKAGLADPECFIAKHIVRHLWKRKQLGAFFLPKALYRGITLAI